MELVYRIIIPDRIHMEKVNYRNQFVIMELVYRTIIPNGAHLRVNYQD